MKASPASILSLLVAATAAPGRARDPREPAADLVERIRAMTAAQVTGLASEIDVDQPLAAQGFDDGEVFGLIIELEETYRIEIDAADYGSDGNTADKTLSVRGLARIVSSYL